MDDNINDGFNGFDGDDSRASLLKGIKIKFSKEGQWVTGDDDVIEPDREFLVVELVKHLQKWKDDRPVETVILGAMDKFPDLEKLNNEAPREEWREKFGKTVGPWETGYTVYLVDPETWEIFSFPTSTVGGSQAIRDLRQTVYMARRMMGDSIYPRVRLATTHMKTQYGGRERPHFEVISYEKLRTEQAALTADETKMIDAPAETEPAKAETIKPAKPPVKRSAPAPKSRKAADPDFDNVA